MSPMSRDGMQISLLGFIENVVDPTQGCMAWQVTTKTSLTLKAELLALRYFPQKAMGPGFVLAVAVVSEYGNLTSNLNTLGNTIRSHGTS